MASGLFSPWDLVGSEIAFALFAVLVVAVAVVCLALGALGLPFWKLSDSLHPRWQEAMKSGQKRRARRIEIAQSVLDRTGELVVGSAIIGLAAAVIILALGVEALALVVAALVVFGLLGAAAEHFGLTNPYA